ncbi:ribonuclease E/G [Litorisediminicola beolgyonensis]|uniref:Ribonuclease E/G n=1 Tax=Litorisediminicola beolgyonensis TaxID=1173614 RepID=A0ABW3ZKZ6_9RHOB
MKGSVIALDHLGDREAAALIVDGQLEDLLIEGEGLSTGAICRGIARRPMKGQGGLFLDGPEGPLYLRQIKGISPGEPLIVQVTGQAEPGKALPVTAKLLFKSRYAIVTPDAPGINVSRSIRDDDTRDMLLGIAHESFDGPGGLILRSECVGAEAGEIAEDIAAMVALAGQVLADSGKGPELLVAGDGPHALAWRDWPVPDVFDQDAGSFECHGVTEALERARRPEVALGNGASMWIEPTRALVAVDVNTGGDTSPAAGLKATIAALRALPRALRVRGLGGLITIDPAPVPKKERRQIETVLRAALKADRVETTFVGWTPMGNIELQRKRDRVALSEVLS